MTDSNCRPSRCKRDALPAELIALILHRVICTNFLKEASLLS